MEKLKTSRIIDLAKREVNDFATMFQRLEQKVLLGGLPLPHQLNELCLAYPRQLYKLLMAMAWQSIDAFGWNHKFLGAQTGATMVLQTFGGY